MTHILSDSSPPAEGNVHGVVASIKAFTLWLGGSLAGITAMLYATGYLVTRAQLSLLGLHGIVDFNNDYIIQEGAKFFLVIGYSYVLSVVLPLLAIGGIASAVVLALKVALRKLHARLSSDRVKAWCPRFEPAGMLRVAAYAVLLFVFLCDTDKFLDEFQAPLCVANLLYANPETNGAACATELRDKTTALKAAILNRSRDSNAALSDKFTTLVYATAKTALLAYLIWQVVEPWPRWRVLLVALPLVAVCFYTVSLPLDYAVLQRPVIYPRITLTLGEDSSSSIRGPLFLLNKTASDFVIWDASARRLLWFPAGSLKRLEVIALDDLFAYQRDGQANPERKK